MKIAKSSRHSKITGDFAERLVLYWLSKYGFECAYVDHVGMDIIARNPHTSEVMGISVKSRSRNTGKEGTTLNIKNTDLTKLGNACSTFACVPYFAIVTDEHDLIRVHLLTLAHLTRIHPPGASVVLWKCRAANLDAYDKDPFIRSFRFSTKTTTWWP